MVISWRIKSNHPHKRSKFSGQDLTDQHPADWSAWDDCWSSSEHSTPVRPGQLQLEICLWYSGQLPSHSASLNSLEVLGKRKDTSRSKSSGHSCRDILVKILALNRPLRSLLLTTASQSAYLEREGGMGVEAGQYQDFRKKMMLAAKQVFWESRRCKCCCIRGERRSLTFVFYNVWL